MQTKTYTVHRTMQDGAKEYLPGDKREMTEADAVELVALGALSPVGEEPVDRHPGVVHTFGEKPNEYTSYTSAYGEPVDAGALAPKPIVVDRKPAKAR